MISKPNEFEEDVVEFAAKYGTLIGVIAALGLFTLFLIIWFWRNKTTTNSHDRSERQNIMELRRIERPPVFRNGNSYTFGNCVTLIGEEYESDTIWS